MNPEDERPGLNWANLGCGAVAWLFIGMFAYLVVRALAS